MKRLLVLALTGLFLASLSLSGAAAQNADRTPNGSAPNPQWAQQDQKNDEDGQIRHQHRHRMMVDGQAYNCGDCPPISKNGRQDRLRDGSCLSIDQNRDANPKRMRDGSCRL